MALEFQFAFLGPGDIYIASLTKTSSSGCPQDDASVEFYGLPKLFCEHYKNLLAIPAYIYNIRGHDFLSFVGQWQGLGRDDSGPLETNLTIYNEIDELEKLAAEERSKNKLEGKRKQEANFIASFGPSPNSFFADSFRLERYRWRNLPYDLEDEIQEVVCEKGWAMEGKRKIYDVAMDANGGWVMQLNKGKDWKMGGQLNETLRKALVEGKRNGVSIAKLFLNHQHPAEYVLLFSDGIVHARLHEAFKVQLHGLLKVWSEAKHKKNKNLEDSEWFNFTASSVSSQEEQQKQTAAYYARRGIFHHLRGNILLARCHREIKGHPQHNLSIRDHCVRTLALAHKYLRVANEMQPDDLSIQASYVDTLKVVRNARYDPILEDRLRCAYQLTRQGTGLSGAFYGEDDDKKDFRNEYVWAIGMLRELGSERMAKELESDRTQVLEMSQVSGTEGGWSYAMATGVNAFTIVERDSAAETQSEPANNVDTLSIGETGTEWSVRSLPLELPHRPL